MARIIDAFDHFLFDLDGCIYLGEHAIPSAPGLLAELRRRGKGVLFVTNDPRNAREGYAAKLRSLGIEATAGQVLSNGWATARYIQEHHPVDGRTVYVIGTEELKQEFRDVGLRPVENGEARSADFVVVGGHSDFNLTEMKLAGWAVMAGAEFYATNRDANYPTPEGLVPGTGAILAGIEMVSGRRAIAVGKPEPPMIEVARSILGPGRMIMVGDRLDSDIAGGKKAGIATAVVLTGCTRPSDLVDTEWMPDYVLEDVGGILTKEC